MPLPGPCVKSGSVSGCCGLGWCRVNQVGNSLLWIVSTTAVGDFTPHVHCHVGDQLLGPPKDYLITQDRVSKLVCKGPDWRAGLCRPHSTIETPQFCRRGSKVATGNKPVGMVGFQLP